MLAAGTVNMLTAASTTTAVPLSKVLNPQLAQKLLCLRRTLEVGHRQKTDVWAVDI